MTGWMIKMLVFILLVRSSRYYEAKYLAGLWFVFILGVGFFFSFSLIKLALSLIAGGVSWFVFDRIRQNGGIQNSLIVGALGGFLLVFIL